MEWQNIFCHANTQERKHVSIRQLLEYFHYPNTLHQELLDSGECHERAASSTTRILKCLGQFQVRDRATRHLDQTIGVICNQNAFINVYDVLRRALIAHYFEFFFERAHRKNEEECFVAAITNMHETLKGKVLGNKKQRDDIKAEIFKLIWINDEFFDKDELDRWSENKEHFVEHVLGVFFFTGVVQVTEIVAHALLEAANHSQKIQKKRSDDSDLQVFCDALLHESLRLYPQFVNAVRSVSETFEINGERFPAGEDVIFNFVEMQRQGWEEPAVFDPLRWIDDNGYRAKPTGSFCPFGIGKRQCPAKRYAMHTAQRTLVHLLSNYTIEIDSRCRNSRRLPLGVTCRISSSAPAVVRRVNRSARYKIDVGDANLWSGLTDSTLQGAMICLRHRRVQGHVFNPALVLARLKIRTLMPRYSGLLKWIRQI